MKALIRTQAKAWDLLLLNVEFAYNREPYKTTSLSPFKTVHGVDPLTPRDLVLRIIERKLSTEAEQRVKKIQALHDKVRKRLK